MIRNIPTCFSRFQNFDIFEKRKTERERTISIPLKDKNNNNTLIDYKDDTNYVTPYINFFDEPDEICSGRKFLFLS